MEWSPPMVAVLASSFPSRIMVLFSRLEHFRASSNASIQHRPEKTDDSRGKENSRGVFYSGKGRNNIFKRCFSRNTGEFQSHGKRLKGGKGWMFQHQGQRYGATHAPNPLK